MLRLVAHYAINRDDLTRPPADTAPGVIDTPIALPILHSNAMLVDGSAAVGAMPGAVPDVALAIGVPPTIAREPSPRLRFLDHSQVPRRAH